MLIYFGGLWHRQNKTALWRESDECRTHKPQKNTEHKTLANYLTKTLTPSPLRHQQVPSSEQNGTVGKSSPPIRETTGNAKVSVVRVMLRAYFWPYLFATIVYVISELMLFLTPQLLRLELWCLGPSEVTAECTDVSSNGTKGCQFWNIIGF